MKKTITILATVVFYANVINTATVNAQIIASRGNHSIAVCNTGSVQAWGDNSYGQLGNGSNTSSNVPIQASLPAGITAISGGGYHTIALKNDSTVWDWGFNYYGELGNGNNTDKNTPVQVNSLTGIKAISGGWVHNLALKSDGTVWAWGYNLYGQLGNGNNANSNVPVQVNSLSGIIAVAGGDEISIALKNDGTVWSWGNNNFGELGNGNNTNNNVPVQVSSLTGIISIVAGYEQTLALKNDGTVWAWGYNGNGQLGLGNTTSSNVPLHVSSLTGIMAIAAGWAHSLALKNDGTVWAFGNNGYGQLGNGNNTDSNIPVQVSSLTGITAIAAGNHHNIALKNDGSLWTWGWNQYGQLGNGNTASSNVPVQVTGLCQLLPPAPIANNSVQCGAGIPICSVSNALAGVTYKWYDSISGGPLLQSGISTAYNSSVSATDTLYVSAVNAAGESVRTAVIAEVNAPVTFTQTPAVCAGHSFTVGSNIYNTSNTYIDTVTSIVTGCDSIVTTILNVLPSNTFIQSPTLCAGQSLTVGNNIYTTSNTYIDTVTSIVSGCDSIVTSILTILPSNTFTQSPVVCAGHSITVGGATHIANGNYTDVLTSVITGCDSTVTTNLTVNGIINTTTNISGVSITANQAGAAYKWLNCSSGNSIIAGATSQTYTASANGNYAVLVSIGSCSDTSACVSIGNVGINESAAKAQFVIYPNPFTSQTTISFLQEQKNTIVKILDVLGKEIKTINFTGKQLTIEKVDMHAGIYFVQVTDENKNAVNKKIVVQ